MVDGVVVGESRAEDDGVGGREALDPLLPIALLVAKVDHAEEEGDANACNA